MVLLNTGQFRVEYEDVLRALGNYLDASDFRHITIVETPDGFMTKGVTLHVTPSTTRLEPVTYLFTNDDIELVLEQAHARRGVPQPPAPPSRGSVIRYEDALRAIGRQIDGEKLYDVAIIELASGTVLKAAVRPDITSHRDEHIVDVIFSDDDVLQMIDEMRSGRSSKQLAQGRGRWPFR